MHISRYESLTELIKINELINEGEKKVPKKLLKPGIYYFLGTITRVFNNIIRIIKTVIYKK